MKDDGGWFCRVLFLIFLVLKLTGLIDWSWWWVTAPLWGTVAVVLLIILVMVMVAAFVNRWPRKKRGGAGLRSVRPRFLR